MRLEADEAEGGGSGGLMDSWMKVAFTREYFWLLLLQRAGRRICSVSRGFFTVENCG